MVAGGNMVRKIRWIVSALAGAILLTLAVLPEHAAQADPNVYVAAGIPVDLTGDLTTLREKAMLQAQRLGLQKVLSTIASPDALKGLTLPSDDTITSWVQDFQIDEEKTSASRYIGKFTFRFQADPIRQFLTDNNIPYAEAQSKAVLVLPVFTNESGDTVLWGQTNPWFAAWASRPQQSGLVPIQTPTGDLSDVNTITATQALAGDQARIQSLSDRYAASDVMVAEATLKPAGADGKRTLALSVMSYGPDGGQTLKDQVTSDSGDVNQLLSDGVDRVASLVQNNWKQENLVDPNARAEIKVHVPFSSLSQWVEVKRHLAQVNLIKSVNLTELSRSGADLELTYLGDEVQFVRALQEANLMVTQSGEGMETMTLGSAGGSDGNSGGDTGGGTGVDSTGTGSDATQSTPQ